MKLDRQLCYAVIKSRDERFNGLFFTAVRTTGIYCRPVCPAITPRLENIEFFATAAAAAEAGFRPCLRCRPELSPETLEWRGPSAPVVARALRLMAEGEFEEGKLETLAARLHLSARQLRRHFVKELGVPPVAVAQTQRLLLAKRLIDETHLSMAEVAFSAGYNSIRRFNHAVRQTYEKSPSELRQSKLGQTASAAGAGLELKLFYRLPYNWEALARFLGARAIPAVEVMADQAYRRTVRFGADIGIIEVRYLPGERYLLLRVPLELARYLRTIIERVQRLFDLKAVPEAIAGHLGADPALAEALQQTPGLRLPGAWDGFELAVRAILGQQISVKAATSLSGRLAQAYGEPLPSETSGLRYLFPTPGRLAAASLTGLGLMPKRAETIRALSRAVAEGNLALNTAAGLDEAVAQLVAVPGIGAWTAHYIAMRALGEPDAFPAGDLILRRVASPAPGQSLTETQLRQQAEAWRPWRAYAAMLLWSTYNKNGNGSKIKSKE